MTRNPMRPSVIWTRRGLVLAVFGGIIWGVVAFISFVFGLIGGFFHPAQPNQVAGGDCQAQQIKVQAHVGNAKGQVQGSFNPSEYPYFWFTITNTASVECKFNVGTSASFYTVTSGNETIWTSKDCILDTPRSDTIMSLPPGQELQASSSDWERVRSSSSGCTIADGQAVVSAGGASYHLKVEVNGVISDNDVQFVLN